jgi:1-acyl-sn-glycerol-3-phosphate acyltransferase
LLCGATANWIGCAPEPKRRIYFANHASHLDFLVVWSALPTPIRAITRPVAGRDYWEKGHLRPFLAKRVFRALLIERRHVTRQNNPLRAMLNTLDEGHSLIIFPEGTRSLDGTIRPFKAGLHHLSRLVKDIEFIPVYLNNLSRILPKGDFLPIPLLSSVSFGSPLEIIPSEPRAEFLKRAREAVVALDQL